MRCAVHEYLPADDGRVGCEAIWPQSRAENDDLPPVDTIVGRLEQAT
jgi:hypothetical protein